MLTSQYEDLEQGSLNTTTCVNEDVCLRTTHFAQQQWWIRHFIRVPNMRSQFNLTELEKVYGRDQQEQISQINHCKMCCMASCSLILKLKNGKCGGSSGILLQMVKASCRSEVFVNELLDLVQCHTV